MLVCKSSSNRSGLSSNVSTQALGRLFFRWGGFSALLIPSHFTGGQIQGLGSGSHPSASQAGGDSNYQHQFVRLGENCRPPVLSQDTWLQISGAGIILRPGTTTCSWGRDKAISGAAMCKMKIWCWRRPWQPPLICKPAELYGEPRRGAWLTVLQSIVNKTDMGDQWKRNALFLRYSIDPPYLPPHCDRCYETFYLCNVLYWKKVGLITTCHNELCDGDINLAGKSFSPLHVRNNPRVHTCRAMREGKAQPMGSLPKNQLAYKDTSKQKGYLLICDLWHRGTDSIHNMRVFNTGALSRQKNSP